MAALWPSSQPPRASGDSPDAMAGPEPTDPDCKRDTIPFAGEATATSRSPTEFGWRQTSIRVRVPRSSQRTTTATKKTTSEAALGEHRAVVRQQHNRVGKKYRDKMNGGFGHLLAALHVAEFEYCAGSHEHHDEHEHGGDDDGDDEGGNVSARVTGGRSLNKARLLDMAREHVRALLEERRALSAERDALRGRLQLSPGGCC